MATKKNNSKRDIADRWGGGEHTKRALLGKNSPGFVGVPNVLLANIGSVGGIGLTPTELVFILLLMSFKWDEHAPYPGYKKLAKVMGKSEGYMRQLARDLEDKKMLVRRQRKGETNAFDLRPLFQMIDDLSKETLSAS